MQITFSIDSQQVVSDLSEPIDISIPLHFNGPQPNHFDVPPATMATLEAGGFIGDTRRGGGCNVETLSLIPHCNGTHTESAGHILDEPVYLPDRLHSALIPSTLVSLEPLDAGSTGETYRPVKEAQDQMITGQQLQAGLASVPAAWLSGLIIRTRPNSESKKSRRYSQNPPPFLSIQAIEYLVSLPVDHLLIDTPSVDRMFDNGALNVHHHFWRIPAGSHAGGPDAALHRTITEMIFVPDSVPDGQFLVNIQVPNFLSDAAPSRVLIYPIDRSGNSR